MQVLTYTGGPIMTNTYVVAGVDGQAVLVDPAFDLTALAADVAARGWTVAAIVGTHGHFDHVCCASDACQRWAVPYYLHADSASIAMECSDNAAWFQVVCANSPAPSAYLADGDCLRVGDLAFEVADVSGHCPGSIALIGHGAAFVGDVLFAGSVGRTDLPHSDSREMMSNIRTKLMPLADDTVVYPGHGPATTIGEERLSNPFAGSWL